MSKEKYQLAKGATIFYDDESDMKVVGNQTVELDEDEVTPKTTVALMSGALVKVKAAKQDTKTAKDITDKK